MASEQEKSALRTRVAKILKSKECFKIRFRLGNVGIQSFMYTYIAQAVQEQRVKVDVGDAERLDGFTARYFQQSKLLLFASADVGEDSSGKETIVHEATHAVIHATHCGVAIRSETDETAAYLAETIYGINCGHQMNQVGPLAGPLYQLARKVISFNASHNTGLCLCTQADTFPIKVALASLGKYGNISESATMDGIGDGPTKPPMRPDN